MLDIPYLIEEVWTQECNSHYSLITEEGKAMQVASKEKKISNLSNSIWHTVSALGLIPKEFPPQKSIIINLKTMQSIIRSWMLNKI